MRRVWLLPADHAPVPPPRGVNCPAFASELARTLGHSYGTLTASGRAAMTALFRHLGLRREDEVYIATTFDYPNVSSCVTCTVFNFAKPSRVMTGQTRAIFVIHEFGVPHPGTPALRDEARRRGIPLIEDCAHTVASVAPEGWHVGELGDWAIASFPKVFPVRRGGLLAGPPVPCEAGPDGDAAAVWWSSSAAQWDRRRAVYGALSASARASGLAPVFDAAPGVVPWLFPVAVPDPVHFMEAARAAGVECGLWHGSNVVVLPCHQGMAEEEIEAVIAALAGGVR